METTVAVETESTGAMETTVAVETESTGAVETTVVVETTEAAETESTEAAESEAPSTAEPVVTVSPTATPAAKSGAMTVGTTLAAMAVTCGAIAMSV
ncbi:hypothetical protein ACHAXH_004730 [Discostella pseudostelligera]